MKLAQNLLISVVQFLNVSSDLLHSTEEKIVDYDKPPVVTLGHTSTFRSIC